MAGSPLSVWFFDLPSCPHPSFFGRPNGEEFDENRVSEFILCHWRFVTFTCPTLT
jgi:hypothetical protein